MRTSGTRPSGEGLPGLARTLGLDVDPRHRPSRTVIGGKAESGGSAREVADQVPEQAAQLDDGREDGEEQALQLSCDHGERRPRELA